MASDYVLLLAICFNRRELDVTTIWNRINSAIEKGLAECDGDDVDRFIACGLDHVLANPNVAACQEDAVRIQEGLMGLPEEARAYFLQYLAKHRMPAIVFGRKKWQDRKDELARATDELIREESEVGE